MMGQWQNQPVVRTGMVLVAEQMGVVYKALFKACKKRDSSCEKQNREDIEEVR